MRWNVVVLGDGYQHAQLPQFHDAVQSFVDTIRTTDPYQELWSGINLYRIDVASTDTGADDAADQAGGSGAGGTVRTYFDASFGNNGIHRLLEVNDATVHTVVNNQLPQAYMIIVIVNSTDYGGSGGSVATFSLAASAEEIALHEMGHTALGLADEYESYVGCGVDAPGTHDRYPGPEPLQPNISIDGDRMANKSRDLVDAATPMPTTSNPDCGYCDPRPNTQAAAHPRRGVRGRRLLSLWSVPAPVQSAGCGAPRLPLLRSLARAAIRRTIEPYTSQVTSVASGGSHSARTCGPASRRSSRG